MPPISSRVVSAVLLTNVYEAGSDPVTTFQNSPWTMWVDSVSVRIRFHPAGGSIRVPEKSWECQVRAAIMTSPAAIPVGRGIVSWSPSVLLALLELRNEMLPEPTHEPSDAVKPVGAARLPAANWLPLLAVVSAKAAYAVTVAWATTTARASAPSSANRRRAVPAR